MKRYAKSLMCLVAVAFCFSAVPSHAANTYYYAPYVCQNGGAPGGYNYLYRAYITQFGVHTYKSAESFLHCGYGWNHVQTQSAEVVACNYNWTCQSYLWSSVSDQYGGYAATQTNFLNCSYASYPIGWFKNWNPSNGDLYYWTLSGWGYFTTGC